MYYESKIRNLEIIQICEGDAEIAKKKPGEEATVKTRGEARWKPGGNQGGTGGQGGGTGGQGGGTGGQGGGGGR